MCVKAADHDTARCACELAQPRKAAVGAAGECTRRSGFISRERGLRYDAGLCSASARDDADAAAVRTGQCFFTLVLQPRRRTNTSRRCDVLVVVIGGAFVLVCVAIS